MALSIRSVISGWLGGNQPVYFGPDLSTPNTVINISPEQAVKLPALERVRSLYASQMAAAFPRVYSGDSTSKPLENHPAQKILRTLSAADKAAFGSDLVLYGNGYLRMVGTSLTHLPASLVTKLRMSDGSIAYQVAASVILGTQFMTLRDSEVIHTPFWPAQNALTGESPIQKLSQTINLGLQIQRAELSVFANVAAPSVVMETEKALTPEVAQRLRERFTSGFSGTSLGKALVLDNGLKLNTIDIPNLLNLQLTALKSAVNLDIARAYGVPASLVGEMADINRSTAQAERLSWLQSSLSGLLVLIADSIAAKMLSNGERSNGVFIGFDVSDAQRGSGAELAAFISSVMLSGTVTANEARAWLGLETITGGDTLRHPLNMTAEDQKSAAVV
ncbi:phage portal protein [Polynucleobacter sp. es-GGE-1]|uniref:phage portal protein n=1 Tax=Polynucleobacter sp. es-GGE-1 TaxID=1819724 RepID=UPI001C0A943B|nr:phage portal protein [Polynucleobacter sp. es-GGE-1]MBU3635803.1 phage portal protein [Polynucleobacter sp. es-GGE-1]